MIKGPKGTTVKITVKREGSIKEIDIVRDVVKIDALKYEIVDGGKVMLVKIYQFGSTAPEEFQSVVEIMQNNPDIKGLIIDVRDNPGGLLDAVDRIMNFLFKPETAVVNIEYNYFSYSQYSSGKGELAGFPMVVLINKGSASASEILAGALKDYGAAKIIGETSFGKGSVQEVNYFPDNSSLKLTIAKWLTPLNNTIDKTGITPDITVTDLPSTVADEQMDRALIEINKLINK
jgi:carboxyl-terminal processing protease